MSESRTPVIAVQAQPARAWAYAGIQAVNGCLGRAGGWFSEVAQKFAALLADLMGPAVFLVYSFTLWSMAQNLGWTDTFVVSSGPLSNWLVWLGLSVLLSLASHILKRRVQTEQGRIQDTSS